jgi:hypothetical protein
VYKSRCTKTKTEPGTNLTKVHFTYFHKLISSHINYLNSQSSKVHLEAQVPNFHSNFQSKTLNGRKMHHICASSSSRSLSHTHSDNNTICCVSQPSTSKRFVQEIYTQQTYISYYVCPHIFSWM